MSLIVYAYKSIPEIYDTSSAIEKPRAPFNNLFGFEHWRETVWDSLILRKLNCTLLNSLSYQDIHATNEELLQLKNELEVVKENINSITSELNLDKKSFEFRVENGLEAVRIAQKETNGIVYIG